MASTYLSRTPSSAGNRRTWTWSGWVKRGSTGTGAFGLFTAFSTGSDTGLCEFYFNNDTLRLQFWTDGVYTSALFRDPSAWYHIVVAVDTTQATGTNRVKMYVNGVEQSLTFGYTPSLNLDTAVNNTVGHSVGSGQPYTSHYFDGYMAHVNFCDGTQYTASDFGETDTNGQWKPKTAPSVTYGTNGFFLKFANSGSLGTDSSGNGNNFTQSGSGDQVTDTPDNVFATLNSVNTFTSGVLSVGNLIHTGTAGTISKGFSTLSVPSGKWYAEVKNPNGSQKWRAGVRRADYMYFDDNEGIVLDYNFIYKQNTEGGTNEAVSWSGNDHIIGIALNKDDNQVTFYVDGSQIGSVQSLANTDKAYCFFSDDYSSSAPDAGVFQWNFGNPSFTVSSGNADANGYGNFEYAPPTGFLALCTKNLASQLTLPIGKGSNYMNTVLYTGTGSARDVTGFGFQPDWLWLKQRSGTTYHRLYDSSRGAGKEVYSNATDAEYNGISDQMSAFISDGFSVPTSGGNYTNINTATYVAWGWKVNAGTTSSNTDGATTSTVQVNQTAGFSVVTYDMGGSNSTFGHGLGKTPACIFFKRRNAIGAWVVYHQSIGVNGILNLNTTDAAATGFNYFPNMTSTIVGVAGSSNLNNDTVAYCFAEIEGYSKFGSYVANGNVDGTFAYTGFRPALVIIKQTNSSAGAYWFMFDSIRSTYNVIGDVPLAANATDAEGLGNNWNPNTPNSVIDFVSNGFKLRTTSTGGFNVNGNSYVYMAFAEHPFVDSTGRPVTAR